MFRKPLKLPNAIYPFHPDDEGDIGCTSKKRSVRLSRSIDISKDITNANIKSEIWTPYKLPSKIRHNLLFGEKIMLEKLGIRTSVFDMFN